MNVIIIGATGFIGKALVKELAMAGHRVVSVSRDREKAKEILGPGMEIKEWDGLSAPALAPHLEGMDAVINLAGESIASGRWTAKRKERIIESRVGTSRILVEALRLTSSRPSLLIQGSAIGYYGSQIEGPSGEAHPPGTGFIAELTLNWEKAVLPAKDLVSRVIILRTGLVLGKKEGLLKQMIMPFRFGLGAVLGSGKQWMSWIHIDDLAAAVRFLAENGKSTGPYNLTAPSPVRMNEFIRKTGKTLGNPFHIKIPGILIKGILGEMAEETVLSSQNIVPARLQAEGYRFNFLNLEPALVNLLT
jgi:uncharacterized protein